ncbi:MAG: NAD(P)H-dependent oxidoreductase subunit E [Defluviitaleaceae bacterium]|nr:NAD(P)H-dependent oxidoreductase subunit E [Defluviitaleaceae bacterium]
MDNNFAVLDEFIENLPSKEGALISVLHKAQDIWGFLPPEVQEHIAMRLDISASKIYGVVTFYSFFSMQKKGKFRVNVCMGTACFVKGAEGILEEFKKLTADDEDFSVDALRCIGACGLAPVVTVNGKYYGRIKKGDVKNILVEVRANG